MLNKTRQIIRKNLKWIAFFICIIIFIEILEEIFKKEQLYLDMLIYQIVVEKLRIEPITSILKIITNLGGSYVLIAISLLSLFILKNKKIAVTINVNLIISTILNLILKNIIQTAHDLGFKTLCEGIETEEHKNMVVDAGCDMFQGYYFYRPMPVTQLETLFEK